MDTSVIFEERFALLKQEFYELQQDSDSTLYMFNDLRRRLAILYFEIKNADMDVNDIRERISGILAYIHDICMVIDINTSIKDN